MTDVRTDTLDTTQNLLNDPLFVASNETTNIQLTPMLFDGTNFISWGRYLKLALGAKSKLGFIDGTLKIPEFGSKDFARWQRGDHFVRCWIFRSMKEEIANDFSLVLSAQQLWHDISERFAQSSAPLLFQLKRELANLEQGDLEVAEYYSKMKRKWDEINELEGIPQCNCGALDKCACGIYQKLVEREEKGRIIDFLMKLNPNLKDIRGQILAMDPLPHMNRVFQLVHQSEREKKVAGEMQGGLDVTATAFMAQRGKKAQYEGPRRDFKKEKQEKMKLICEYCGKRGHNVASGCFELIGYPDWFKAGKGKAKTAAHVKKEVEESPLDGGDNSM